MCGFAGIINSKERLHSNDVSQHASKVSFRGPDNTGVRIYNNNWEERESGRHGFFFNRLKIIDLSNSANQPFETERYLLLFNGEIYNYKEIRDELIGLGHGFVTSSDTEVVFYALRQWGKGAVQKFNGMFAIFWLDKKEQTFLVTRDRLGIKPLYYRIHDNSFTFGSELDSIVRLSGASAINTEILNHYLFLQYVPAPHTIIKDVCKLEPGSILYGGFTLDKRLTTAQCFYWDVYKAASETGGTTVHSPEALEEILTDTLSRQLQSDVPIGLFLSSGVDSSLLAGLVNKHFTDGRDYNFFTVAFAENVYSDESAQASQFLKGFDNPSLKHHLLEINSGYIQQHIEQLYQYHDEPFGDMASLLNLVISKKARDYVTVALSGDGGDELFWGYPRYLHWAKRNRRTKFQLQKAEWAFRHLYEKAPTKLSRTLYEKSVVSPLNLHFDLFRNRNYWWLNDIHTDTSMWCLKGVDAVRNRKDFVSIIDVKTYLADAMLYKVDRSSMAASLEVRVPFLDNKVIDYALSLRYADKLGRNGELKPVLKNLLSRVAPHYDLSIPKHGFNFPLDSWLKNDWKEMVRAIVTKDVLDTLGLDSRNSLELIGSYYSNKKKGDDVARSVWMLFNVCLWYNEFKKKHG